MTPSIKILLGALLTAILAWFLHGPMGFGARCMTRSEAATAPLTPESTIDNVAIANATAPVAVPAAPASEDAAASCQTRVDEAVNGKIVNFGTGGAAVAIDSGPLLDMISATLKDCTGTIVTVAGHTDARGSAAANMALSQKRAQSVVAALTERGVPAERLIATGLGETHPIDPHGPENDPKNRRIEFSVATVAM